MTRLTLPWPPSVNRYYRNVAGVTKISAEGRAYRAAVVNLLAEHRTAPPLAGAVAAGAQCSDELVNHCLRITGDLVSTRLVWSSDFRVRWW